MRRKKSRRDTDSKGEKNPFSLKNLNCTLINNYNHIKKVYENECLQITYT